MDWRVDLLGSEMEILLEFESHHFVLFSAVTKGTNELAPDFTVSQVVAINYKNSV
jgi:hypothetical protein